MPGPTPVPPAPPETLLFWAPRCSVKHSVAEEGIKAKLSPEDLSKVNDEVEAALTWVQTNQVGAAWRQRQARPVLVSRRASQPVADLDDTSLRTGLFCMRIPSPSEKQGEPARAPALALCPPRPASPPAVLACASPPRPFPSLLRPQLMAAEKYEAKKEEVEVGKQGLACQACGCGAGTVPVAGPWLQHWHHACAGPALHSSPRA